MPTGVYPRPSAEERFLAKVDKTESCWLWTGHCGGGNAGDEYGRFYFNGRMVFAHRFAYEHFVGPIPDGLTIDHLCRVKRCVRPDHLEPTTQAENTRRGLHHVSCIRCRITLPIGAAITAHQQICLNTLPRCAKGHEYTEANTYLWRGNRKCRTCHADYARAARARQRQGALA